MTQKLIQAYQQTPWRQQLRGVVWILLVVVAFVLVATANLSISAKTYAAGIEIQILKREKGKLDHNIADLKNQLGSATSFESMAQRAQESGYGMVNDAGSKVYLSIPGYQEPEIEIDMPKSKNTSANTILKPVYTQSLWDLFLDGALKLRKNSQRK